MAIGGLPLGPGAGGVPFAGGALSAPAPTSPHLMNGPTARPPRNGFGLTKGPVGGKNTTFQDHMSPHSGMRSTITHGDPLGRAVGHYGKMGMQTTAQLPGQQPTQMPGRMIRGGLGQMRRIRGGLGPGRMGQPGGAGDYSMSSMDTE